MRVLALGDPGISWVVSAVAVVKGLSLLVLITRHVLLQLALVLTLISRMT